MCGNCRLKYNFVLFNPLNNIRIQIGTTCILRFGVGKGVFDVESGIKLLQNIVDDQFLLNEIRSIVPSIMVLQPDSGDLNKLVGALRKLMEIRGIAKPTDEHLKEVFFGAASESITDPFKLDRMRKIWDKPGYIETARRRKNTRFQANPKEGETWFKKRKHVLNHGGTSEVYKVDEYVAAKVDGTLK